MNDDYARARRAMADGERRQHIPEAVKLRDDMDHVPGQLAAQRRLAKHSGSLFAAFDSLDIGIPVDAALDYVERPLKVAGMREREYGRVVGVMLGFAITMVEAERARVEREGGQ